MAPIAIDSSEWPLLVVDWKNPTSTEEIQSYIDQQRTFSERNEPFALLIKLPESGEPPSAEARSMIATYKKEAAKKTEKPNMQAIAYITTGRITRGVLTAIQWLAPGLYPEKTFAEEEQARLWLKIKLDKIR